jgi:hypothetical protein
MADERRTKLREAVHLPNMKLGVRSDAESLPDRPLSPEQNFLKRKTEVTQQDHEEFSTYVQEKSARDQQQKAPPTDVPQRAPLRVDRRSLLRWAAGSAAAGEAAALGYQMVTGQDIPAHGVMHSAALNAN